LSVLALPERHGFKSGFSHSLLSSPANKKWICILLQVESVCRRSIWLAGKNTQDQKEMIETKAMYAKANYGSNVNVSAKMRFDQDRCGSSFSQAL
jgi:hypothetical protein